MLAVAVVAALGVGTSDSGESTAKAAAPSGPNFVFVLTDDLSTDLLPYMKQVQAMKRQGTSFSRYIVTDSLCCPSRSTIFSGRYPHSTGVFRNEGRDGGFHVFHKSPKDGRSEEADTFATSLNASSYETAMMGKYMNGYKPQGVVDGKPRYVPPGWSAWSVAGNGYPEYDYNLLDKRVGRAPTLIHHGHQPADYLTDVLNQRGRTFMDNAVRRGHSFMLEVATFAPHGPFTPAPRDARRFPRAKVPRTKLFNRAQRKPRPHWLSTKRLGKNAVGKLDRDFRKRARAVQAVDKMIGDIRAELQRLGVAQNTYIVFSSDNGFHMGQRRMTAGKMTAFDHDVRVPLVVIGPSVPRGKTVNKLAANVDLRPTFQQLAGAPISNRVEGRSLVPFLRGDKVTRWRRATLIEHHGPDKDKDDPDRPAPRSGNPPTYRALRFTNSLYVRYAPTKKHGARSQPEFYDLKKDPLERHNVYRRLSSKRKKRLKALMGRYGRCSSGTRCHAADSGS